MSTRYLTKASKGSLKAKTWGSWRELRIATIQTQIQKALIQRWTQKPNSNVFKIKTNRFKLINNNWIIIYDSDSRKLQITGKGKILLVMKKVKKIMRSIRKFHRGWSCILSQLRIKKCWARWRWMNLVTMIEQYSIGTSMISMMITKILTISRHLQSIAKRPVQNLKKYLREKTKKNLKIHS